MNTPIVARVIEQPKSLPQKLQRQVLEFARALAQSIPRGVRAQRLSRFVGAMAAEDAELLRQVIE
ncbi:MAG: hypothetical protein JW993_04865 [Sedimentisphaerales bacterium]|nr:hypothetical protein [Sedimentisphaerales bacterium]